VANFPGLATVGQPVVVGDRRAAMRTKAGTSADSFFAVSMICTHQHTTINVDGVRFRCPNHGSVFAADGSLIAPFDPRMPPLARLNATYNATTDTLTVE
jgi:Rieske Fe-S protein